MSPCRHVQQGGTAHRGYAESPFLDNPVSCCPTMCTCIGEKRPRCSEIGLACLDSCRPCSATASEGRATEQEQEGFQEEQFVI